ncbi:MAG: secretion protein EspK [Mycobacterium sp.]
MGLARPAGEYAEQMISAGGWPEVDEATLSARSEEFAGVSRQLGAALDNSAQQRMRVFEGGIWSGAAADAANDALGRNIDQLTALKSDADDATRWHNQIAGVIAEAKSAITDNVEAANATIATLQHDPALDADERTAAIKRVIATTNGANTGLVAATAEQIRTTGAQRTPPASPTESLDQTEPSSDQNTTDQSTTDESTTDENTTDENTPDENTSDTGNRTPAEPQSPGATESASGALSSLMSSASSGSSPTSPTAGLDTVDQSTPFFANGAPVVSPGSSTGTATPGRAGGVGKGLSAAALSSSPVGAAPVASAPMMAPRSAEDPSAAAPMGAPMGAGAAGGAAAGSGKGSGKGSAAPTGTRPAATSTPRQKTPAGAGGQKGRRQEPDVPDRPAAAAAAAPPIPVSAARAERDAIAAATAPEAAKRGGADPLALARRVAAALNATDSDGAEAFGFFWMTAVSTDGEIVVANSYGLAYIPAGVQLPEPVQLVTADAEIPAVERAGWVTYPAMAVQGWAAHHNKKLRAVIATSEQFGGSDPGAAKVVLEPEDIPATGAMAGRSRLEVVDPEAAARLAETADGSLLGLLSPAPAGSSSPPNLRRKLWSDVWMPLTSSVDGREVPHLRAFGSYAAFERDTALAEAHTATETDARRAAVADWLYWRHVGELLDSALGGAQ